MRVGVRVRVRVRVRVHARVRVRIRVRAWVLVCQVFATSVDLTLATSILCAHDPTDSPTLRHSHTRPPGQPKGQGVYQRVWCCDRFRRPGVCVRVCVHGCACVPS